VTRAGSGEIRSRRTILNGKEGLDVGKLAHFSDYFKELAGELACGADAKAL
jgi:hypothetical protein